MDKLPIYRRFLPIFFLIAALHYSAWGMRMASFHEDETGKDKLGQEIEVLIVPGQNAMEVAAEFERLGAVKRARELAKWMGRLGIDRKIRPGIYRVTPGRAEDVARALLTSRPDVKNLKILPGALFQEIAGALGKENGESLLRDALADRKNFPAELEELL